jgi:endonuclease III-like uncharacterized protein
MVPFKVADSNHDGVISKDEYKVLQQIAKPEEVEKLKEAHGILGELAKRYLNFDVKMERRPIEVEAASLSLGLVLAALVDA